jgi:hypothetical protein
MSPESRAFLDLVRDAEDPTPEDQARVHAALRSAVAAGAAVGVVMSAAKSTKLFSWSALSAVKLGAVVVGLAGGVWLIGAKLRGSAGEQRPVRAPAPVVVSRSNTAEVASSQPSASAASSVESAAAEVAPARSQRLLAERHAPEAQRPSSLREEIALLAAVQRALDRGDGAAALARLDRHATTDRQLMAERSAARIRALCALGRVDEAQRAALEFVRAYPASLQRAAVERSCAGSHRFGER